MQIWIIQPECVNKSNVTIGNQLVSQNQMKDPYVQT